MKGDLKKGVTHMSTTSKVSKILSLTLLLGINVISNSYTATLQELLESDDAVVNVDQEHAESFIDDDNNTTYIDMNTLPIQNSIGGGGSISKYNW